MFTAVFLLVAFVVVKGIIHTLEYTLKESPSFFEKLSALNFLEFVTIIGGLAGYFYLFIVTGDLVKMLVVGAAALLGSSVVRLLALHFAVKRACALAGQWRRCSHAHSSLECATCIQAKRCDVSARILKRVALPVSRHRRRILRPRRPATKRPMAQVH